MHLPSLLSKKKSVKKLPPEEYLQQLPIYYIIIIIIIIVIIIIVIVIIVINIYFLRVNVHTQPDRSDDDASSNTQQASNEASNESSRTYFVDILMTVQRETDKTRVVESGNDLFMFCANNFLQDEGNSETASKEQEIESEVAPGTIGDIDQTVMILTTSG